MQNALVIVRSRKLVEASYGPQVLSEAGWLKLRILPPQKPKGQVALLKAIERDLARPSR